MRPFDRNACSVKAERGEYGVLGYLQCQKVGVINRWFFLVLSPLFQGVVVCTTSHPFTNYLDEVVWVVTNFLTVTVLENKEV